MKYYCHEKDLYVQSINFLDYPLIDLKSTTHDVNLLQLGLAE